MLLVKFVSDYADKFDVSGFRIMKNSSWNQHKIDAANLFANFDKLPKDQFGRTKRSSEFESNRGLEVYFGTNESMIYETLDCYLRSFEVISVSDDEIKTLKKLFGAEVYFGLHPMLDVELYV